MPESIVVNSIPIEYPAPGDSPGWGEAATQFAVEVAEVLNDLNNPNDILETTFNVANNVSVFTNISGLSFSTGQVRAASIDFSVNRESDTNPSGNSEIGLMQLVYDDNAAPGSKWLMAIGASSGVSGITFNITDAGQVQYKSSDIGSTNYSGQIRFRAKTILST